jgi:ATP-dependent Lon protease
MAFSCALHPLCAFPRALVSSSRDLMRLDRIPLFPLNVVLFPGEQLPLHIFEPRYRRMVRECLDENAPFGMLLALEKGIVRVGCTAEILETTKRYDDGRIDIITVGRVPFRIVDLFAEDPLLEGQIDYLEDRDSPLDPAKEKQLIELYETCHTLLFADIPRDLNEASREALSYAIASCLPVDLLWKQQILELRTEADRQERLLAYLRDWAPHLQKEKGLRHRAVGNGHGLN